MTLHVSQTKKYVIYCKHSIIIVYIVVNSHCITYSYKYEVHTKRSLSDGFFGFRNFQGVELRNKKPPFEVVDTICVQITWLCAFL